MAKTEIVKENKNFEIFAKDSSAGRQAAVDRISAGLLHLFLLSRWTAVRCISLLSLPLLLALSCVLDPQRISDRLQGYPRKNASSLAQISISFTLVSDARQRLRPQQITGDPSKHKPARFSKNQNRCSPYQL